LEGLLEHQIKELFQLLLDMEQVLQVKVLMLFLLELVLEIILKEQVQ
jgi:hypothetical protein